MANALSSEAGSTERPASADSSPGQPRFSVSEEAEVATTEAAALAIPDPLGRAFGLWRSLRTAAQVLSLREARQRFDEVLASMAAEADVHVEELEYGGVRCLRVLLPKVSMPRKLLFFHGGAFTMGSPQAVVALASHLGRAASAEVILPDYRLAPEHPYPAAPADAVAVYEALVARGTSPECIAVGGDSAGGGIALAAALSWRGRLAHPCCVVCFSPWVDLALTGDSVRTKAEADPLLDRRSLQLAAAAYLAGHDPTDPCASPIYGDFRGFPAVLVQAGSEEILVDDARRLTQAMRAAGVDVTLEIEAGLPHAYQYFTAFLPEARSALDRAGAFIATHTRS